MVSHYYYGFKFETLAATKEYMYTLSTQTVRFWRIAASFQSNNQLKMSRDLQYNASQVFDIVENFYNSLFIGVPYTVEHL